MSSQNEPFRSEDLSPRGSLARVTMPHLGDGGRVTIRAILKARGVRVSAGEPLFRVSHEGSASMILSPADGVLSEVNVMAGAWPGEVLATIDVDDGSAGLGGQQAADVLTQQRKALMALTMAEWEQRPLAHRIGYQLLFWALIVYLVLFFVWGWP